mgnify:CR=1 FL=1
MEDTEIKKYAKSKGYDYYPTSANSGENVNEVSLKRINEKKNNIDFRCLSLCLQRLLIILKRKSLNINKRKSFFLEMENNVIE